MVNSLPAIFSIINRLRSRSRRKPATVIPPRGNAIFAASARRRGASGVISGCVRSAIDALRIWRGRKLLTSGMARVAKDFLEINPGSSLIERSGMKSCPRARPRSCAPRFCRYAKSDLSSRLDRQQEFGFGRALRGVHDRARIGTCTAPLGFVSPNVVPDPTDHSAATEPVVTSAHALAVDLASIVAGTGSISLIPLASYLHSKLAEFPTSAACAFHLRFYLFPFCIDCGQRS